MKVNVNLDKPISELKKTISSKLPVQIHEQKLIFGGRHLEDQKTPKDYNISSDCQIYLVIQVQGGKRNHS